MCWSSRACGLTSSPNHGAFDRTVRLSFLREPYFCLEINTTTGTPKVSSVLRHSVNKWQSEQE